MTKEKENYLIRQIETAISYHIEKTEEIVTIGDIIKIVYIALKNFVHSKLSLILIKNNSNEKINNDYVFNLVVKHIKNIENKYATHNLS